MLLENGVLYGNRNDRFLVDWAIEGMQSNLRRKLSASNDLFLLLVFG